MIVCMWYKLKVRLVTTTAVVVTKLGAVARENECELLHGFSRRFVWINVIVSFEVSSLVLYTGGSGGIASSSPSGIEILR